MTRRRAISLRGDGWMDGLDGSLSSPVFLITSHSIVSHLLPTLHFCFPILFMSDL